MKSAKETYKYKQQRRKEKDRKLKLKRKENRKKKKTQEEKLAMQKKKAARANWQRQVQTDTVAVMCSEAWATTYQKPMKYTHRAKRRRDKEKKSEKFLNRIDGSQLTHHAVDRSIERDITMKDITVTLKNGSVFQKSAKTFKVVSKGKNKITVVVSKRRGPMEKKHEVDKPRKPAVVDVLTVYKNYK